MMSSVEDLDGLPDETRVETRVETKEETREETREETSERPTEVATDISTEDKLTDEVCRRALTRAHQKVIADMKPEVVLDGFKAAGFLSDEDHYDLKELLTDAIQNRILVSKVSQSDKTVYLEFKKCLKDSQQDDLVKDLEEKEKELIVEIEEYRQIEMEHQRLVDQEMRRARELGEDRRSQNAGESAFNVLRRDTVITKTIRKDLHDGRLIELTNDMIEELKRPDVSDYQEGLRGGFGKVYISKEEVPGFELRVVLKEINLKKQTGNTTQKLGIITNEKIAARLMHFGIVPLLGYYDDHITETYYFVSPYFENGDLYQAIQKDKENLDDTEPIILSWDIRLKIMYHVSCAIDFMHTGNIFRGTILHMDIKSKNIVLDANFNARLIDFGLARELSQGEECLKTDLSVGTPGYFYGHQKTLTKQHDYQNFGVVIIELITGQTPFAIEEGLELRNWHKTLIVKRYQKTIWKSQSIVENVAAIAVVCTDSATKSATKSSITSEKIMNKLKKICRTSSISVWEDVGDDDCCEICLVNEPITVGFDGHDIGSTEQTSCSNRISTCCSCMRNSYINPIKCHTCGETIKPFINADWGAILVHGYDGHNKEVFKKDITQFEKVITSKVLPAMCMSSENVITCENKEQIDQAIATLFKNEIKTVMFVYSGHNDDGGRGLQLGKDEFYSLNELSKKLNKWKKKNVNLDKVIVFLDCCYPDKINLKGLKLIQINATAPTVEARADKNAGSPFLQYVIQAFTAIANGKGCNVPDCECSDILQDSFITLDTLWDYLNEHFKNGEYKLDMPYMNADNISLQDTVLAYNCNFKVQFEFTIQYPGKKETRSMRVLPSEFNTFDQLKSIGAAEVIKHVCDMKSDNSSITTKVADTLSIEINTGPRSKHIQEVDTIEKLLLAWTSKRILRCTARQLISINVGKPVGRLLTGVPEIRNAHQAALQKCAMKDQHLTDIKKYKEQIDKNQNAEYFSILDMISHQTKEEQLKGNRWEISFFDLPNSFTLVHLSLVKVGGI